MSAATPPTPPPGPLRAGLGLAILLLSIIGLILPFLLPIPEVLDRNFLIRTLGHQLHVLLFFLVTLLLYWRGPLAGRLVTAAAAAAGLGAGVEYLQILVQRHPRFLDFGLDLLGIGLAVCWIRWHRGRSQWARWTGAVLLAVFLAQFHGVPGRVLGEREVAASFPILADFESRHQASLWADSYEGRKEVLADSLTGGRFMRVTAPYPASWPGVAMGGFPADWSDYRRLEFRARLVAAPAESLVVHLRLDDWKGEKEAVWGTGRFTVRPQWEDFSIDLRDMPTNTGTRRIDLRDMRRILIYLRPVPQMELKVDFDDFRLR